ncbi:hypothetical protein L596_015565 [Steinernema carpocapsae]|uniref:Uncharacterized protein n=1 Tax=Steinernema carpocapsae TaxID=34508 RepID=A0A4U5NGL5_STECR|nr:hypothetical protein L596_015565 [Steinernema carpocapsae]
MSRSMSSDDQRIGPSERSEAQPSEGDRRNVTETGVSQAPDSTVDRLPEVSVVSRQDFSQAPPSSVVTIQQNPPPRRNWNAPFNRRFELIRDREPMSMVTCGLVTSSNMLKIFLLLYWLRNLVVFTWKDDNTHGIWAVIPMLVLLATSFAICLENHVLLVPFLIATLVSGVQHVQSAIDVIYNSNQNEVKNQFTENLVTLSFNMLMWIYIVAVIITIFEVQLWFQARGRMPRMIDLSSEMLDPSIRANSLRIPIPEPSDEVAPSRPLENPPSYTTVMNEAPTRIARQTSIVNTDSSDETAPPSYSKIAFTRPSTSVSCPSTHRQ